jgi:hypothetical protein
MGALRSCAGLDVGADCLWVEIGAGQAIETKAPIPKTAFFYFLRKANGGDYVVNDLVVDMKVISEVCYQGEILQAVVAGDEGGSHGGGRVGTEQ